MTHLHVHWESPVIKSISRKPTKFEFLYMNLLENHAERCRACRPLLTNHIPNYCRRGQMLENLVLRDFTVGVDGRVYSTLEERVRGEWVRRVQVEISQHYWAVRASLEQVDRRRIRSYSHLS